MVVLMLFCSEGFYKAVNYPFLSYLFSLHFHFMELELNFFSSCSTPKPVFHMSNGKKPSHNRYHQEIISPQHEEIIKFIYDCKYFYNPPNYQ